MNSQQTKPVKRTKPALPKFPRQSVRDVEADFLVDCVRRGLSIATL